MDEDELLEHVVKQVPLNASAEYGRAYMEISKAHDNIFSFVPGLWVKIFWIGGVVGICKKVMINIIELVKD